MAIEAQLRAGTPVTVAGLGGITAVLAEADELVAGPYLDVLVQLAGSTDDEDATAIDGLVLRAFREGTSPTAFRGAGDMIVESERLRARLAPGLAPVLARRIEERAGGTRALLAAYALEALFRLALAGAVSSHRPLAILAELSEHDDGLFAEHGAKLAGAAYHVWRDGELLAALDRLRRHPDAESEAAFELGLATLAQALDAGAASDVAAGLEAARVHLTQARAAGEDRADAAAYHAVIELITLFARGAVPDALQPALDALAVAVADRAHLLYGAALPAWLRPRADREAQWAQLVQTAQTVARALERRSWLNAGAVMVQLLAVYDADRTVQAGPGLDLLLRPRIEAALVREAGLLAHVDDLLREDGAWAAAHGSPTRELRERVAARVEELAAPRIAGEGAQYPLLDGALPPSLRLAAIPTALAEAIEQRLREAGRAFDDIANPVVQRILRKTQQQLTACQDYEGTTRGDFDALIGQIVRFCMDRQDAAQRQLGARGAYLRDPDAKEAALQADLREFLIGNYDRADVQTEVEGVAAGRADIYVAFGGHRFVIELKRHHGSVTREVARQYLGQAGAYQGTNVRLGMLGILELVPRAGPAPALAECIWTEEYVPSGAQLARHLVVFRVPGNLMRPSDMSR